MTKAQRTVRDLEEKLLKLGMNDLSSNGDKEVRIFMDGAFDMMHYGHMNAFRKGRAMGTKLIVGVKMAAACGRFSWVVAVNVDGRKVMKIMELLKLLRSLNHPRDF
jgi:cytidyltransferase-like protein